MLAMAISDIEEKYPDDENPSQPIQKKRFISLYFVGEMPISFEKMFENWF